MSQVCCDLRSEAGPDDVHRAQVKSDRGGGEEIHKTLGILTYITKVILCNVFMRKCRNVSYSAFLTAVEYHGDIANISQSIENML
jgi:hypothetical protein